MQGVRVFRTIVFGFGAVLLVFVVIAVAIGTLLGQSGEQLRRVGFADYQTVRTTHLLLGDIVDAETGIRGFELTRERSFLDPYLSGRKAVAADLADLRSQLAADPAQSARIDRISSLFERWEQEIAKPAIELADRVAIVGNVAAGKRLVDAIRLEAAGLMSAQEHERDVRLTGSLRQLNDVGRLLWGGIAAFGVVTFALAWVVGRRLTTNLATLTRAAEAIARGERSTVRLPRGGDLDSLSAAFEKMESQLEERDRTLETLSKASRIFSEHVRLDGVLEPFLDALQPLFPVSHAAIAVTLPGRERLLAEWPAVMVRPRRDTGAPSASRKAVLERQVVVVAEAGRCEWAEDADALAANSRSYAIVPLIVGDAVIGVLALGSSSPDAYSPRHAALLTAVAQQIAGHVATADLYAELDAKSSELIRSSQLKSDFLAMMSHELRTPLNAIIGFSEILVDELFGSLNERQHAYIGNVLQSGRHLLALINDVLDLSKVEAGRMELRLESCEAQELVRGALTMVQPAAERKQLKVSVTGGDALILVDPTRTRQVLHNLLSNAVKFTPEGGEVSVALSREGPSVVFEVRDTGIGISADDLPKLFTPFTQLERPETRSTEGTGLGLALSRRLIELQGGTVSVESELGKGSVFRFTVPHARSGASALEQLPQATEGQGRPRVLVIDDDPGAREIFGLALKRGGYDVLEASTGETGLAIAREVLPDAVILDIMLPGLDGWDLLRLLHGDPRTAHIPVLVASIRDDKEAGFLLGASDYLVKPVDRDSLLHSLRRCGVQATGLTIAAVDDDSVVLHMYEAILSSAKYRFIGFDSSEGIVAKLELARPDLVLLDLMMPRVSGFEVLEEIRASPRLSQVPVVVVTAKDLSSEERSRLAQRTSSIIQKGAAPAEQLKARLVGTLDHLLRDVT
jgi:signal transduction histidine kinase/DNA-binding response OmpR family regulator/CHASE3 domain sensor protein